MYGCYVEVVFHFVAKAILFLCFFGFDIYPYILFHFFKCFFIILVIDEASMIPTHALNAIDRCLQDITGNNECFGGKVMLLGGDFRQVLPVVPRATETVVIYTHALKDQFYGNIFSK